MPTSFVLLADLADQMGMERSNARKYILERGFQFTKVRSREKNNALMLALDAEDAEAILAIRHQGGFTLEGIPNGEKNGHGLFYIVQPMPELDPTRLKFGFTVSMDGRLLSYRAICPEAVVLKTWPCKAIWEKTAISVVSQDASKQLGQELFRCLNIEKIIERADTFFRMLPEL